MVDKNDAQDIIAELNGAYGESFSEIGTRPEQEQLPKCSAVIRVTNAYLGRSSGSNRKQLSAVCEIVECDAGDEYIGHTYTKTWGLETEENLRWLNTDLTNLELMAPKTPADLIPLCNALQGVAFKVQLTPNSNTSYPPNAYINAGARRRDFEDGKSGQGKAAAAVF